MTLAELQDLVILRIAESAHDAALSAERIPHLEDTIVIFADRVLNSSTGVRGTGLVKLEAANKVMKEAGLGSLNLMLDQQIDQAVMSLGIEIKKRDADKNLFKSLTAKDMRHEAERRLREKLANLAVGDLDLEIKDCALTLVVHRGSTYTNVVISDAEIKSVGVDLDTLLEQKASEAATALGIAGDERIRWGI